MTIMLRKEQKAASGEGQTARKFQSNCHLITVGGKWAVTAGPDKENCPEIPEQLPHITVERRANGNRRNYFQHTLFPKPYPLIRTNPARPYDKTTGHFHSGSLTFKMTEQKENERMCIQKEAHLHGYASLSCSCIV